MWSYVLTITTTLPSPQGTKHWYPLLGSGEDLDGTEKGISYNAAANWAQIPRSSSGSTIHQTACSECALLNFGSVWCSEWVPIHRSKVFRVMPCSLVEISYDFGGEYRHWGTIARNIVTAGFFKLLAWNTLLKMDTVCYSETSANVSNYVATPYPLPWGSQIHRLQNAATAYQTSVTG